MITTQTEQAIRDGVTFIESFNVHGGDVHDDLLEAADTHDDLVAALRVCEQDLSDIVNAADNGEPYWLDELAAFKGTAMAHAALAKAEGA